MKQLTAKATVEVALQLGLQAESHARGKDEDGERAFFVILAWDFGMGAECQTAEEAMRFLAGFIEG